MDDVLSVATAYAYEFRQGSEIVSTGRLTAEAELEVGEELTVAGRTARIVEVIWASGEPRLILLAAAREAPPIAP